MSNIDVQKLRPYFDKPALVGWKVLPVELKKQVKTPEQFVMLRAMFGGIEETKDDE